MRNLTLKVDDEVARWARIYAAQQETSVSRLVAGLLKQLKEEKEGYEAAMRSFLSRKPYLMSDPDKPYPKREELYDRPRLR